MVCWIIFALDDASFVLPGGLGVVCCRSARPEGRRIIGNTSTTGLSTTSSLASRSLCLLFTCHKQALLRPKKGGSNKNVAYPNLPSAPQGQPAPAGAKRAGGGPRDAPRPLQALQRTAREGTSVHARITDQKFCPGPVLSSLGEVAEQVPRPTKPGYKLVHCLARGHGFHEVFKRGGRFFFLWHLTLCCETRTSVRARITDQPFCPGVRSRS